MTSQEKKAKSSVLDNHVDSSIAASMVNGKIAELQQGRERLIAEVNRADGMLSSLRQQREKLTADIAAHDGAIQVLTGLMPSKPLVQAKAEETKPNA